MKRVFCDVCDRPMTDKIKYLLRPTVKARDGTTLKVDLGLTSAAELEWDVCSDCVLDSVVALDSRPKEPSPACFMTRSEFELLNKTDKILVAQCLQKVQAV